MRLCCCAIWRTLKTASRIKCKPCHGFARITTDKPTIFRKALFLKALSVLIRENPWLKSCATADEGLAHFSAGTENHKVGFRFGSDHSAALRQTRCPRGI
jgi:hypothetical protein